jgi:hypothetical protein
MLLLTALAAPLGLLGMPAAYIKGTAASVNTADSEAMPRPFKDTSDILERISGFENYSCHEGFENAFPDVKLWASLEIHLLKCDSICP